MAGANMLVGPPQLTPRQNVAGAADRIVGTHPMAGGAARNMTDNPPLALSVLILASVGVLVALHLGGFRSTIAIGRA